MFRRLAGIFGKVGSQFSVDFLQKGGNVNVVAVRTMQFVVFGIINLVTWLARCVHIASTNHQQVVDKEQNSNPGARKHDRLIIITK